MNKFEKRAAEISAYGEIADLIESKMNSIKQWDYFVHDDGSELSEYELSANEQADIRLNVCQSVIKMIEKVL